LGGCVFQGQFAVFRSPSFSGGFVLYSLGNRPLRTHVHLDCISDRPLVRIAAVVFANSSPTLLALPLGASRCCGCKAERKDENLPPRNDNSQIHADNESYALNTASLYVQQTRRTAWRLGPPRFPASWEDHRKGNMESALPNPHNHHTMELRTPCLVAFMLTLYDA